jgi:hypothetical protein
MDIQETWQYGVEKIIRADKLPRELRSDKALYEWLETEDVEVRSNPWFEGTFYYEDLTEETYIVAHTLNEAISQAREFVYRELNRKLPADIHKTSEIIF